MIRDDPRERLAFFRPAALPGTELMVAHESSQPWHVFHERYAFCLCQAAAAGVRYRGGDDVVSDGDVLVREPGETHYNTFVSKPAELKTIYVDPQLLAGAARELGHAQAQHLPQILSYDPVLYPALDGLCSAIETQAEPLELQTRFAATLHAFLRHAEGNVPASAYSQHRTQAVERAKTHLRERYSEAVSLEALATVSGLSRFRLVHAFSRDVGIAPHAYQIHVRVEHARTLLRRGVPPVEVAASVGFADQSHFTRHFKRILRITPSEYARAMRQQ
jgi:AraC-like DNA-binding protein